MKNNFSNILIFAILFSVSSCKMPKLATYEKNADLSAIEATPNGVNKKNFNNGSIYEGEFVNGLPSGNGKLTTPDGKIITGTFYLGNVSYGKIIYKDGNEYTGNFLNNIPNGKGYLEKADGSYYKGEFIDGKINGEGVVYNSKDKSFLYADFDADLNSKGKGVLIDANKNAQPVYYEKGSSENRYDDFVSDETNAIVKEEMKEKLKLKYVDLGIDVFQNEIAKSEAKLQELEPIKGKSYGTLKDEICNSLYISYIKHNLYKSATVHDNVRGWTLIFDNQGYCSCYLGPVPSAGFGRSYEARGKNRIILQDIIASNTKQIEMMQKLCNCRSCSVDNEISEALENLAFYKEKKLKADEEYQSYKSNIDNLKAEYLLDKFGKIRDRDFQNADAILNKHEQFMQHCNVSCECGCIPKNNCNVCAR